ncbi:protein prenyltransferase alpha subunit repeat-containing protein 1 isoform X3 [Numida meleagris]|uniref:protein prenyltransferase alpha subunit repeat-containing protein 1 isoform X3 n=1 Tax=Numida meleagris TaxID=8996 RepID=UPI000B3D8C12|nr:protein prenyltransferase alpha subunit repeat-containing protein 1 isoform X3 [Numida meleagris]
MAESPEEVAVLVQRVVKDIRNAFKRNPHIDEIGLIPCPEARYNRSPIVLVENKLGVESWCVKFLLPYVHNKLLLYRQRKQWLNKDELIDTTCTLLLLNPDFTTAWNVRKELILSGTLSPLKDLHLGKLALTKFPKSPETWIHRRWVLQQLIQENSLPTLVNKGSLGAAPADRIHRLVQEEMNVCSEAAGRYPSNYNAWSHRIWVLQHVGKMTIKVLLDELSSTKYWVSMHVSDHSGFHYRQFLLKSLIGRTWNDDNTLVQNQMGNEQNSSLQTEEECEGAEAVCVEEHSVDIPCYLEEELDFCTDLIDTYPGHETLWCHRRRVFYLQHLLINKLPLLSAVVSSVDSSDEISHNSHPNPATSHVAQAMDVDGLNESSSKQGYTQETKRLKRAPMQDSFGPEMEYRFIDKVLSTCRDVDQARFATAYRKWWTLNGVAFQKKRGKRKLSAFEQSVWKKKKRICQYQLNLVPAYAFAWCNCCEERNSYLKLIRRLYLHHLKPAANPTIGGGEVEPTANRRVPISVRRTFCD